MATITIYVQVQVQVQVPSTRYYRTLIGNQTQSINGTTFNDLN